MRRIAHLAAISILTGAAVLLIMSLRLDARILITNIDLARALENAVSQWGKESPDHVEIILDAPGAGCPMWTPEAIARTETTWSQMTVTPEDGEPIVTRSVNHVIHINPDCNWNSAWLLAVVEHEYGHCLGREHSSDKRSVMYWAVATNGSQHITPEDRKEVAQ